MATAAKKRTRLGKQQRLEARVTSDQKWIIERAAAIRGTSVTDFVVQSAQEKAEEVVRTSEVIRLQREDAELFVKLLLNPPKPNAKFKAAMKRHLERTSNG